MKKFLLIIAAIFCCTIGANAQETPDYFCITDCEGAGAKVTFNKRGNATWTKLPELEYSLDGTNWGSTENPQNVEYGTEINLSASGKLYVRAGKNGTAGTNSHISEMFGTYGNFKYISISSDKNIDVSGNIMSLLYGENFEDKFTLNDTYTFAGLFAGTSSSAKNTTLHDVSALKLPATVLSVGCYCGMFYYCDKIESAPKLPAQQLVNECYKNMFYSCTSLKNIEVSFLDFKYTSTSSSNDPTYYWLNLISTVGTLVCPYDLEIPERNQCTIPSKWNTSTVIKEGDVEINDDEAYSSSETKKGKVQYTRTFSAKEVWEPLYVPFSIEISNLPNTCEIADIYMVSASSGDNGKDVVNIKGMKSGEATLPHTAYFIRLKDNAESNTLNFEQEETVVGASFDRYKNTLQCATTKDTYDFIGSFSGETLTVGTDFILTTAKLLPVDEDTKTLAPNRWYMKKTSKTGEQPVGVDLKEMKIVVIGGDATGIEGVSLTPALSTREGVTYNLQGQRVGSVNGYRGIVIKGGKKFIVK